MTGLHELDLVAVLVEAAEDAVDAIARIAVDAVDPVLVKTPECECSDGFGHLISP